MAERSFATEVKHLRKGAGEDFHGEGILAVTKALLQSGVAYVGGYQGAPISHLMDVLGDAREILGELDVYFENSASEATAAAMLAASVHYPLRGAITFKSTVGTNVASDALANLASGGVMGGALIIVGEDYGEGSSIMQERSHAFAMKSQLWLLDPRPNISAIVDAVEKGFELSEVSNTPVMLELRLRSCHLTGSFAAKDNRRPVMTVKEAASAPKTDPSRIVLPPMSFAHEIEKVDQRWPAAVRYITENGLNEFLAEDAADVGIIVQGGLYNTLNRSMELLGCSDAFGDTDVPLYVMNVTYPVIDEEVIRFCRGKKAVLLVEEGQPDYIEQNLNAVLRRAGVDTALHGKDLLAKAGDYTPTVVTRGVAAFLDRYAPELVRTRPALLRDVDDPESPFNSRVSAEVVQPRPPGLCTGCPERRSSPHSPWPSRRPASTTSPPTSAVTCSAPGHRSISGRPPWGTGSGRPAGPPSGARSRSPCSRWAARAAAYSPTGSPTPPARPVGPPRTPRSPASPSAPVPPSTTSSCIRRGPIPSSMPAANRFSPPCPPPVRWMW